MRPCGPSCGGFRSRLRLQSWIDLYQLRRPRRYRPKRTKEDAPFGSGRRGASCQDEGRNRVSGAHGEYGERRAVGNRSIGARPQRFFRKHPLKGPESGPVDAGPANGADAEKAARHCVSYRTIAMRLSVGRRKSGGVCRPRAGTMAIRENGG